MLNITNYSVQFSHSVVSDSLQHQGQQHARPPCPSPTEMQIKTTTRYHFTPVRTTINKKSTKTPANVGQDVDKMKPSYAVGGTINWCSHYGKLYGGSLKK